MVEKITLIDEKGETFQSDEVSVFNVGEKKILVTTNNELDTNGLVILNVSEVEGDRLNAITDDELWHNTQDNMRAIIDGGDGVDFQPVIENSKVNKASYFRAISVNGDAVNVMKDVYSSKKPVATPSVDEPAVNISNMGNANMFNGTSAIYPNGGAPIVSDMSQAQIGVPVANGINEVQNAAPTQTPTDFQQVQGLGNPVDLIDNGITNVVQNQAVPMGGQEMNPVSMQAMAVGSPYGINNMINDGAQVNQPVNSTVSTVASDVAGQLGSVDPEIVGYLQNLNATIINVVEKIKQVELEKINSERMMFEAEKKDFELRKAGFEAQVMSGINQNNIVSFPQQQAVPQQVPVQQAAPQQVIPNQMQQAGQMMGQAGLDPNMMNQSMMNQNMMNSQMMGQSGPTMGLGNAA